MRSPIPLVIALALALTLPACGENSPAKNEARALQAADDFATGTTTRPGMAQVFENSFAVSGVATYGEHLWIANGASGTIQRVDPGTGKTAAPLPVGASGELLGEPAVTEDSLWFGLPDERVARVDVETGKVVEKVAAGVRSDALAADEFHVWVFGGERAARIDPNDGNKVSEPLEVPGVNAQDIAVGSGMVWAPADHEGGVIGRIDTSTFDVETGGPEFGVQPGPIDYDGSYFWVGDEQENVVRELIPDGTERGRVELSEAPVDIDASDDGVFVLGVSRVMKVDASSGRVEWSVPLERPAEDLAVGHDAVWLAGGNALVKIPIEPTG